jgi:hypothetical protein
MAGTPDAVATAAWMVNMAQEAILGILRVTIIEELKRDLLNSLVRGATGMSVDEWKSYLHNPTLYLNPTWRAQLDQMMALKNDVMDHTRFGAAWNTVALTELAFLGGGGIHAVLARLGYGGPAPLAEADNVVLGHLQSLDGSRQWYATEEDLAKKRANPAHVPRQMVLARDCYLYTRVFMSQHGDGHDAAARRLNPGPGTCGDVRSLTLRPAPQMEYSSRYGATCGAELDLRAALAGAAGSLGSVIELRDVSNGFSDAALPNYLWVPPGATQVARTVRLDEPKLDFFGLERLLTASIAARRLSAVVPASATVAPPHVTELRLGANRLLAGSEVWGWARLGCTYQPGNLRIDGAGLAAPVRVSTAGYASGSWVPFYGASVACQVGGRTLVASYPAIEMSLGSAHHVFRGSRVSAGLELLGNPIRALELVRTYSNIEDVAITSDYLVFDSRADVAVHACPGAAPTWVDLRYEPAGLGPDTTYVNPAAEPATITVDGECGAPILVAAHPRGATTAGEVTLRYREPACSYQRLPQLAPVPCVGSECVEILEEVNWHINPPPWEAVEIPGL